MKKENVVQTKSYEFALLCIKLYKTVSYLTKLNGIEMSWFVIPA